MTQDAATYLASGRDKKKIGDLAGAISDFSKAIELDPKSMQAYNERGLARGQSSDHLGAVQDFTKALEISPRERQLYINRGLQRCHAMDYDGGMEDFHEAIRISPDADAFFDIAYFEHLRGNFISAVDNYSMALRLNPAMFSAAYLGRGRALMALHYWHEAREDFREYVKKYPEYESSHLLVWCCSAMLLEEREAIQELREFSLRRKSDENSKGLTSCSKFLLEEISEDTLFSELKSQPSELLLAYFYAGIKRQSAGDHVGARRCFQNAVDLGLPSSMNLAYMVSVLRPDPGIYRLEEEFDFNVVDSVAFDPETRQISLVGHYDDRYRTAIPYLQHLASLLENPQPKFSLDWTPETKRKLDVLFRRFEEKEEIRKMAREWGRVVDDNGVVTKAGRHLLPLWGVWPTEAGSAPGYLGVYTKGEGTQLVVTLVTPGSPAEQAGLRRGDILEFVGDRIPCHPGELDRMVKFAGEDNSLQISYLRSGVGSKTVRVSLGRSDDPLWAHVDRFDIVQKVLSTIGKKEASNVVRAMGVFHRVKGADPAVVQQSIMNVGSACMGAQEFISLHTKVTEGTIPREEAIRKLSEGICDGMDRHFALKGAPVRGAFNQALRNGGDVGSALDAGIAEMNRQLNPAMEQALNLISSRWDQVTVPSGLMEETLGCRPEVRPEFIDIDSSTLLAEVLLQADYLAKNLFNTPSLKEKIPEYMTEFEFERKNPDKSDDSRNTSDHHLWISIERIDAVESKSGTTLDLRDVKMRFNVRKTDTGGKDLSAKAGGYGDYLTGLYDDLATVMPIYHELRECAKLAAVAKWLRGRKPDLRLPKAGRKTWNAPKSVSAMVYLSWSPKEPAPGQITMSLMAVGGVSLVVPLESFSQDASVVDLRDRGLIVQPEPYRNETVAKVLRHKIEVPPPRLAGWVTPATKGERFLSVLTVIALPDGESPEESLILREKLEAAHHNALLLAEVERAINIINGKNPDRQAEFQRLEDNLVAGRTKFIEKSVSILTQRMLSAHDAFRNQPGLRLGELGQTAQGMREVKKGLDSIEDRLKKVRRGLNLVGGDTNEMMAELLAISKDIATESNPRAFGPLAKVLIPIRRTLQASERLEDVYEMGQVLANLEMTRQRLKELDLRTESEGKALGEKLLPLQRQLSDKQDRIMKDPDIRRLVGGR